MKKLPLLLLLSVFLLGACKKDSKTTKPSSDVTYQTLGTIDSDGKPLSYMGTPDVISPGLSSFMATTFPEFINIGTAHPELLSTNPIADIKITQNATVSITFALQGTSSTDALAFYTYPTNSPPSQVSDIKKFTYIFANVGQQSTLTPGDKVKIGTFTAGTTIGFVVLKNGWNINLKQLNNGATHFYSDDSLNPEADPTLKRHAVMINYAAENKTLIGFEDENRTEAVCDNDFNDVVFYATLTAN